MAKTERKKLTSSIFRKWNARGGLDSPGVQYLDPTKGAIKGNIRWVSLACQIVYCAEYDGVSWAPRDANHPRVAERNSSTDSVTPKRRTGRPATPTRRSRSSWTPNGAGRRPSPISLRSAVRRWANSWTSA